MYRAKLTNLWKEMIPLLFSFYKVFFYKEMTHIVIEFQEKICEILELFINISNNDTTNFTIFLITIDDGL